ncbi:unnamed protein product [Fusarium graminearum]|nr:unnamed protein product [Fusarium graminearum]
MKDYITITYSVTHPGHHPPPDPVPATRPVRQPKPSPPQLSNLLLAPPCPGDLGTPLPPRRARLARQAWQSGSVETGRSSPVTGVSLEVREMLERSMSIRWDEGIGLAGCVWLMALVTVVVVVVT